MWRIVSPTRGGFDRSVVAFTLIGGAEDKLDRCLVYSQVFLSVVLPFATLLIG